LQPSKSPPVGQPTRSVCAVHRRSENSDTLRFREEGLFGHDTYAGGADKLGHAWSNYALTRGISGVLSWGGVSKAASVATSASLAFGFFALIELKDGYEPRYGFSWGDVLFNAGGNALAIGTESFPVLERASRRRCSRRRSRPWKSSRATRR
jgi:hypothetical protein